MSKASAKNNPKQLDAKREKRARQAQRRAEREHPNAAAIAPVRAQLREAIARKMVSIGEAQPAIVAVE